MIQKLVKIVKKYYIIFGHNQITTFKRKMYADLSMKSQM